MSLHPHNSVKDLFDPRRDEEDLWVLTVMVWLTQSVGLTLIFFGLWCLKNMPDHLSHFWMRFWFLGWGITIIWWAWCWYDVVLNTISVFIFAIINSSFGIWKTIQSYRDDTEDPNDQHTYSHSGYTPFPPPQMRLMPPSLRKTLLLRAILVLVIADACFLAVLIVISGGPGHSSLDPLLPIVPIIAIILRQPTRTVVWALGLEFLIALGLSIHWFSHVLYIPHKDISPDWIYNSHDDENYPLAFAIVAAGSVALSGLEYYFSHARPKLKKGIRTSLRQLTDLNNVQDMRRPIKKGTKIWIKWLMHRGLPPIDLSLVHNEQDIIKQIAILSIPYWHPKNSLSKRITRHITFLAFAAHWIDDHFDALSKYCPNKELYDYILSSNPTDIMNSVQPRLNELVRRMERLADPNHKAQVERAVMRIIYGGLIQNAPTEKRCKELLQEYAEYISEGLCEPLRKTYAQIIVSEQPLSIWVTSKVVMELLDSCSPNFSIDRAEFYNLLYGPILYFQDRLKEIDMEKFGAAFGLTPDDIVAHLPNTDDMIFLVETCSRLMPQILGDHILPPARQKQLNVLLNTYRTDLPTKLFDAYDSFLITNAAVRDQMIRERFVELCNEFIEIIRSGKLEEAKQFLSTHDHEFGELIKGSPASILFESALTKILSGADRISIINELEAAIASEEI